MPSTFAHGFYFHLTLTSQCNRTRGSLAAAQLSRVCTTSEIRRAVGWLHTPTTQTTHHICLNFFLLRRRPVCKQPNGRDGWTQHWSSSHEPGSCGSGAEPGGLEPDGEPAAGGRGWTCGSPWNGAWCLHHTDQLPRHSDTRRRARSAARRSDNDGQLCTSSSWKRICWVPRMGRQSTRYRCNISSTIFNQSLKSFLKSTPLEN